MASIIRNYSNDVFISYRQKDNKGDRWVSDFVKALQAEVESTFKEEINVYFDSNPHDGLLETHDVGDSLQEKLRCLVFIPIISRTYCDPKSFAWDHEFKEFIKQASQDQFGLKVKLLNGNVASRVLPIQIHELENEDKKLLEAELGGLPRGIEFIYTEPGVNKPLTADDDEKKNFHKTKYRIQINKTANAIQEIISGLRNESRLLDGKDIDLSETSRMNNRNENKNEQEAIKGGLNVRGAVTLLKKNRKIIFMGSLLLIAIYVFTMINGSSSIPFSEKDWVLITDFENHTGDIVFDQSLNTALEVTIQQSSFLNVLPRARINETLKRMGREATQIVDEMIGIEIAQREGIGVVLVCTISQIGEVYMLNAKIVEANTKKILRTKTVNAEGKSQVLMSLNELAREIRKDLGESLNEMDREFVALPEATTSSLEALKDYANGNQAWFNDSQMDQAELLFRKAIELDSGFALAHAALGSLYYWENNRLKGEEHFTKALALSYRLTEKEKLWIEARVEGFRGNYEEAILKYNIYLRSYPGSSQAWFNLGYNYMRSDRSKEAIAAFNKSIEIYKDNPSAYLNIATTYYSLKDYQQSIEFYLKAFALNPALRSSSNVAHEFGFAYVEMGELNKAREVFEMMTRGNEDIKAKGYRALGLQSMFEGKVSDAIDHFHESILINKTRGNTVSELRDRLFLATAFKTKGMMLKCNEELKKVEQMLKAEGMEPVWYLLYGKFLVQQKRVQKAEVILGEMLTRVIDGNKFDEGSYNILRGEIELAKENPSVALDLLVAGVKLRHDAYALESLVKYYHNTGDLEMAISKTEEIIQIKNAVGWEAQECWISAHYKLGKLYETNGDFKQAIKSYNDFLSIWKDGDADLPELIDAKARSLKLSE